MWPLEKLENSKIGSPRQGPYLPLFNLLCWLCF